MFLFFVLRKYRIRSVIKLDLSPEIRVSLYKADGLSSSGAALNDLYPQAMPSLPESIYPMIPFIKEYVLLPNKKSACFENGNTALYKDNTEGSSCVRCVVGSFVRPFKIDAGTLSLLVRCCLKPLYFLIHHLMIYDLLYLQ